MRISRVDVFHIRIPLRSPFETSYERNTALDKLILKFSTDSGTSFSECTCKPLPYSTSETPATVRAALREFLLPAVMHRALAGPEDLSDLIGAFRGHNMAKASIDNAIWDLTARTRGESLAELLGGTRTKIPVGVGLGIQASVDDALSLAERYLEAGFRRLKLKIRPGWDIDVVAAMRARFPDLDLMVDANSAYAWPDDLRTLEALDGFGLVMIEQPFDNRDLHHHTELQARLHTPICLDESIQGPSAARLAAEYGACRAINVKQGRCGGIGPSLKIHDIAEEASIACWAGNMVETGLGQAYSRHLASLPNFVHASELLPATYYADADVIRPWSLNHDGTVDVPTGPGIGVEVDEEVVRRYTVAHDVVD